MSNQGHPDSLTTRDVLDTQFFTRQDDSVFNEALGVLCSSPLAKERTHLVGEAEHIPGMPWMVAVGGRVRGVW